MNLTWKIEPVIIVEVGTSIGGGPEPQSLKGSVAEAACPRTVLPIVQDTSAIRRGSLVSCKMSLNEEFVSHTR